MKEKRPWFIDLFAGIANAVIYIFIAPYSAITGQMFLWKLDAIDDKGPIAALRGLLNRLRPSNFFGWDITALLPVLGAGLIALLIGLFGYVGLQGTGMIGEKSVVRMGPVDFMFELVEDEVTPEPLVPEINEVAELPEPYCLSEHVVVWGDTFYVAHPGMHLSDEAVKGWYAPFFIGQFGYIPDDIRPLAGIDGSTDSIGSHYIDAWDGQIYIDHIPCK